MELSKELQSAGKDIRKKNHTNKEGTTSLFAKSLQIFDQELSWAYTMKDFARITSLVDMRLRGK